MNYLQEICQNREYWEAVLGKEICEELLKNHIPEEENTEIFEKELIALEQLCEELFLEENGWEAYSFDGTFGNFFRFFGRLAVRYARDTQTVGIHDFKNTVLSNFYSAAAWIPIRVLIQDIQTRKEKGQLQGKNDKEEYKYYQDKFLNDRSYIRNLCIQYPEMKRLLFLQAASVTEQLKRIAMRIEDDREVLNKEFFPRHPFQSIEKIGSNLSDRHKGGQTVAKVYLDNQRILIYKPRSLEKDNSFFKLYGLFCDQGDLPLKRVSILARDSYSWEEYIERNPCKNETEIKRYFERMGILLFLCWLMDVSDMHGENIVADGEYPMPIDLETLPGCPDDLTYQNADQKIREELGRSVLSTGILPVLIWGKAGKGIVLNALNKGEAVKTPFRIPVICDPESSKIHMALQQGEKILPDSLPVYQGKTADPSLYAGEIIKGFELAYEFFLREKEQLMADFGEIFSGESRYLVRHTQQYHMYLQTSFYPEFLENGGRRKLFCHILDKNKKDKELLKQERAALCQMDIPVFYRKGEWKKWQKKVETLGETDLKKQLSLIEVSLGLLEKRRFVIRKENDPHESREERTFRERSVEQIQRIADAVCDRAVVTDEDDIGFYGLQVEESGNFRIGTAGIHLYEGIGGITIFLARVLRDNHNRTDRYEHVFDLCIRKLFCYTERAFRREQGMGLEHTGAYLGEGSVVFTYLLLYEITKEKSFLAWAQRHAELVEQLQETETSMDFLSGLSGAVMVFARLYKATGKKHYLETAVRMGERAWAGCKAFESGAGWCLLKGTMPLAGLAHGNSGLLLAFGYLLELTQGRCYEERIEKLLLYEDSLYENGNWKDLRHPDEVRLCNNAWCHGAAGILISRQKLKQGNFRGMSEWLERDVERCKQIFLEDREPGELCLCHGLAGNYLALGQYLRTEEDLELEKEREALGERILKRLEDGKLSPRERYNPALMTGLSGIGFALCEDSGDFKILG